MDPVGCMIWYGTATSPVSGRGLSRNFHEYRGISVVPRGWGPGTWYIPSPEATEDVDRFLVPQPTPKCYQVMLVPTNSSFISFQNGYQVYVGCQKTLGESHPYTWLGLLLGVPHPQLRSFDSPNDLAGHATQTSRSFRLCEKRHDKTWFMFATPLFSFFLVCVMLEPNWLKFQFQTRDLRHLLFAWWILQVSDGIIIVHHTSNFPKIQVFLGHTGHLLQGWRVCRIWEPVSLNATNWTRRC